MGSAVDAHQRPAFSLMGVCVKAVGRLPVGEVMLARAVVSLTISRLDGCAAAGRLPPGRNAAALLLRAAACSQRGALLASTAALQACRFGRRPRWCQYSIPPSQPCWPGPLLGERLNGSGAVLLAAALGAGLGVGAAGRSGPCWGSSFSPGNEAGLHVACRC